MNYVHLEKQANGKVKGEAEFSGKKFCGEFPDMELAVQWAADLEEETRKEEAEE